MRAWGGGTSQVIAERIGEVLSQQFGWRTPFFVPEDSAQVAFHGPSFDFSDPESAFDAVVETLGLEFGIRPSTEFWRRQDGVTMGQLVSALHANSAA